MASVLPGFNNKVFNITTHQKPLNYNIQCCHGDIDLISHHQQQLQLTETTVAQAMMTAIFIITHWVADVAEAAEY